MQGNERQKNNTKKNKMTNPNISIGTLNINDLNTSIKTEIDRMDLKTWFNYV